MKYHPGYLYTILSCFTLYNPSFATDLYVDGNGSGANCIESDPCPYIQLAIDNASEGDHIHVAAGTYTENIRFGNPMNPNAKPGITISGEDSENTFIISAGTNTQRPAGVPADIIVDVWSRDVVVEKLTLVHPTAEPSARDIGVFVGPPAANFSLLKTNIVRNRIGSNLEPWQPGSRGILVFRARQSVISKNSFAGNYEDHIHMPTSHSTISNNIVSNATRLGIVIIQETADSDNSENLILKNTVRHSGNDGIQIQGDNNTVLKNTITHSAGAGIKLCGESDGDNTIGDGDCVNPFDRWANASDNTVLKNSSRKNLIDATVDNGSNNVTD